MLAAEEGKKSGSGLEQAPRSPSPPSSSAIGRELGPPEAPSFMEEDEGEFVQCGCGCGPVGMLEIWGAYVVLV